MAEARHESPVFFLTAMVVSVLVFSAAAILTSLY
jgi:hypothetical protein